MTLDGKIVGVLRFTSISSTVPLRPEGANAVALGGECCDLGKHVVGELDTGYRMNVRENLKEVADALDELPKARGEAIEAARAEGITWREIAAILSMTENGVHKAYNAWKAKK